MQKTPPVSKPSPQVSSLIKKLKDPQKEICMFLREMIKNQFPSMVEKVAWEMPVYMANNVNTCYIKPNKKDVNFGFQHGAQLKDTKGILEGSGKNMRHIKINTAEGIDTKYLVQLLAQAKKISEKIEY